MGRIPSLDGRAARPPMTSRAAGGVGGFPRRQATCRGRARARTVEGPARLGCRRSRPRPILGATDRRTTGMPIATETESRKLLRRLQAVMAEEAQGQERLDRIVTLVSDSMGTDVCSIYLHRDERDAGTLRHARPERRGGPRHPDAAGRGPGGPRRAAARPPSTPPTRRRPAASATCPKPARRCSVSFLGVPVQRLGERLGVLVVQSREARVLFRRRGLCPRGRRHGAGRDGRAGRLHRRGRGPARAPRAQVLFRGVTGQEGRGGGRRPPARPARRHHQPRCRRPRGRDRAPARGGRRAAPLGRPDARMRRPRATASRRR